MAYDKGGVSYRPMSFSVSKEMYLLISDMAAKMNINMSECCRMLINRGLDRVEKNG